MKLFADAQDPQGNGLLYTWTVTAGRLRGEGRNVTWILQGVREGTYTATGEVNDGNQHTSIASTSVTVGSCSECITREPPCPAVSVACPSGVRSKTPLTFEAILSGGDPTITSTYQWSLSAGKIISGQGTSKVVVDVSDLAGKQLTGTLKLGGYDPRCSEINIASCTTEIGP